MPRLTNPESGITVSVSDDYAEELKSQGWKPATAKPSARKAPAKSEK